MPGLDASQLREAWFAPFAWGQVEHSAPQALSVTADGLNLALRPAAEFRHAAGLRGIVVLTDQTGRTTALELTARPGPSIAPAAALPLWQLVAFAVAAGMILNLMPCVFPVLSLKALSLLHHNEEGKGSAWAQGWVYTAGVLVSVWAIAAPIVLFKSGTGRLGWGYQMQSPLFVAGLTALFLLIALNLFGLFEVGEGLTQLASVAQGKKGLSESFWSGAVATAAATPCTAPFMASALGFAVSQPAPVALLIFTMLGFGMAFPYLVLCGFPATRTWLPRPGAWMESFKQLMGFPMLGAVVWFLYILANLLSAEGLGLVMAALVLLSMASWMYGRWGYSPSGSVRLRAKLGAAVLGLLALAGAAEVARNPAYQPTSGGGVVESGGLTWEPYSKSRLEELRQQGKPVFIDFTASWCVNCKVNELGALRNKAVVEAFRSKGIVMIKADWTRKDEAITRALAEFGRTGVPFYVLYPRSGEPIPLPEILTPGNILAALDRY
jgi:thiol:disulfide interchange protein DsbD